MALVILMHNTVEQFWLVINYEIQKNHYDLEGCFY